MKETNSLKFYTELYHYVIWKEITKLDYAHPSPQTNEPSWRILEKQKT